MNCVKLLTVNVVTCTALIGAGFSGAALAERDNSAIIDINYESHGSAKHSRSENRDCERGYQKNWWNNYIPELVLEQNTRSIAETGLYALYVVGDPELVDQYFAQDHIQHNPIGLSGIDYLKDTFIAGRPEGYKVESDFSMVDGEYYLSQSRLTGFTALYERPLITVDVFRVEDNQIVEHWDVVQEEVYPEETVSASPMFPIVQSGEVVSEKQEKRNARMVTKAVVGLANGDATVLDKYYSEEFLNHNPTAPHGLDYLRGFATAGVKLEVGAVIADGPYVALQTRVTGFGPVPIITFDIFRVSDNLIVEHWDVLQNEVPVENTASGNPMFPIM